jgi:sugar phosphate permease
MRATALPVYYGWFVLAASAVSEMLVMGATAYASGLFVLPLQAEFHISRADANSSILILFLGASLAAPLVGKLLDRYPIRLVMTLGAIVLGLSFAGIALAPALWMMAVILLVPAAVAFMSLGPLNTSTLAARWFHRRRGLAMGIAAVATSGGGFTVVPLLSMAIQHYGWRQALLYEGAAIAVIIIALALLVLRDRPSDLGLENHPENLERDAVTPPPERAPLGWKAVFTSRAFWIPSLTLAGVSGTCQATVITLVPYGVQLGVTPGAAALLISAFAISAGTTKVLAGLLADRVNPRLLLIGAAAFMTLSWLIPSLSPAYGALFASSCLAGIALGCALPTAAKLIATGFGAGRFGSVMGWTYAMTLAMAILAVRFVGFMYDRFGSYHAAFQCFAALLACLLLMTLLVAPARQAS